MRFLNLKNLVLSLQSLTIIIAPLYILRTHIFIPTTSLEIILLVSLFLSAILFFKDGLEFSFFKSRFNYMILFFLITACIAVATSYNRLGGFGILKAYFFEPVLFYFSIIYTSKKYSGKFIIPSLLVSAFWLSLLGLLQKITGGFSLAPNEIAQGRISAVYNSANDLALYIGPIIGICFALFIRTESLKASLITPKALQASLINKFESLSLKRSFQASLIRTESLKASLIKSKKNLKAGYFVLFIFLAITLVWTRSRGGLIALLLSLGTFAYTIMAVRNKILQKVWFLVPLVVFFIIGLFLFYTFRTYNFLPYTYGQPYTQGDTLQIRYFIWAGTVDMLKDHPVFGAGLDGFKTLYASGYRLPQYSEDFQYPHNLLLTFWAETGIVGLFSFLLILVSAFGVILRKIVEHKDYILGAGLLSGLAYIVIHGVVDVPYFKNDLSLEFWVLIALIDLWSQDLFLG